MLFFCEFFGADRNVCIGRRWFGSLDLGQAMPCWMSVAALEPSQSLRKVGPAGKVVGVDASSEMLARAQNKATKAALDIDFRMAAAEALPFADATFVRHADPKYRRRRPRRHATVDCRQNPR